LKGRPLRARRARAPRLSADRDEVVETILLREVKLRTTNTG